MLATLILLALLTIGGVALVVYDSYDTGGLFLLGIMMTVIGGVILLVVGLGVLAERQNSAQFVERYKVLESTIQYNREKGMSELERLELNKKLVEYNEILSQYKYANEGHFYDISVVDEVSKLPYLK